MQICSDITGDQAKTGEMVVVRFRGSYKGIEFDNTFNSDQPYYYRLEVVAVLVVVVVLVAITWSLFMSFSILVVFIVVQQSIIV